MKDIIKRIHEYGKDYLAQAYQEGYQEGYKIGLRESIKKLGLRQQMALILIEIGYSVEQISEETNLPPQRIRALTPL
ncbi:hypothetical protein [uncultured Vagococcus sp.]|uniref:hypothetical protein n=1 Tax=uncultured Vagococcus sp. TaxID=189676 RepID=UPI0028D45DE1|nr:hypothetical protein [uncultured Vagococcus sp.]